VPRFCFVIQPVVAVIGCALDSTLKVSENIWLNAICYALSVVCFGVALFFVMGLTISPANETAANVILKPLKAALIGGLLTSTALTNAYGGNIPSTFDPNLPVVQISEQCVATQIPWLSWLLVQKQNTEFKGVPSLLQMGWPEFLKSPFGDLLSPSLKKSVQDWAVQEKSKLSQWQNYPNWSRNQAFSAAQHMALVDVNKFVNDVYRQRAKGWFPQSVDRSVLQMDSAILKMALLKDMGLGWDSHSEQMFLSVERPFIDKELAPAFPQFKHQDTNFPMNLVVQEQVGWKVLWDTEDDLLDIKLSYPNGFIWLINSNGVYEVDNPLDAPAPDPTWPNKDEIPRNAITAPWDNNWKLIPNHNTQFEGGIMSGKTNPLITTAEGEKWLAQNKNSGIAEVNKYVNRTYLKIADRCRSDINAE